MIKGNAQLAASCVSEEKGRYGMEWTEEKRYVGDGVLQPRRRKRERSLLGQGWAGKGEEVQAGQEGRRLKFGEGGGGWSLYGDISTPAQGHTSCLSVLYGMSMHKRQDQSLMVCVA